MFLPCLKSHDSAHRLCCKYYLCVVLCALPMILPHVPWEMPSLFNGKPHPDHLMGPPPCRSDLSLTYHLKVAIPDHPLPCLLIDSLSLIREYESQEGSILVCPGPSHAPSPPPPHTHTSVISNT